MAQIFHFAPTHVFHLPLVHILQYLEDTDVVTLDSVSPCIVRTSTTTLLILSSRVTPNNQATTNHEDRVVLLGSLSCHKFSVVIKVQKLIFVNIKDAGLASLAGGCGGLTSVDLSDCVNITDAGLASLAGGCGGLTSVDLSLCNITVNNITVISINYTFLDKTKDFLSFLLYSILRYSILHYNPHLIMFGLGGTLAPLTRR